MATASHELRNPLNGIIGMLQLLEKEVKEGASYKFWEIANSSSNLLLFLVNDLLDYSKIAVGTLTLSYSQFSPATLISDTVHLLQF